MPALRRGTFHSARCTWPGELVGKRGFEDAQRLAELHRAALELPQHAEELLGGALGDLRRDRVGRHAGHPLAEPPDGPPGEAQW
jgi:hypothetical protein